MTDSTADSETSPRDVDPAPAADPLAEVTLASRLAWSGSFLRVFEDRVRCADGHIGTREYLRHPGAVMVVPLLDDGRVIIERQYRYPLARSFIEFPAGKIDAGEDPLACAQRELREETGFGAADWRYLGGFHNAIGYCDEKIEVFLARGLSRCERAADAGEVLEILTEHWTELFAWVRDGRITDVKTILGLYWLRERLAEEAASSASAPPHPSATP